MADLMASAAEALILEPGEILVIRLAPDTTADEVRAYHDQLNRTWLKDRAVVLLAEGLAVLPPIPSQPPA